MTLIERLEALTGPCRECDALIYAESFAPEGVTVEQNKFNGEWCVYLGGRIWEPMGKPAQGQRYTASIDAAMTLVPEGLRWCIDTGNGEPRSFVEPPHPYNGQPFWGKHSTTPAIALCIAALKARGVS